MSDLSNFLLARIAEDESVARDVLNDPWRSSSAVFVGLVGETDSFVATGPKRILAECEAKRRIVESARHTLFDDPLRRTEFWRGARDVANADLSFLALPYADHPDYRQEWAL